MRALVAKIKKYISIWISLFNNSLTRDMEFKANFIGGIIVDFIFYGTHFFFFSIIFSYVDSLLEFTKHDVMIFLIITFLSDTVYMFLFSGNLMKINQLIVKGDLDFFLLKPISSQFLVSFRYVKSYTVISLLILGFLLFKMCLDSPRDIEFINLAFFILSFIFGLIIWASFDFCISCLSFWFKNFSTGGWFSHEVMKFSMRPDTIYAGWLRKTLFTVLPMAFITSIPTRILIFGPSKSYFIGQIFIVIIFLLMTRLMWNKGIAKYESASS
tara:strand:- start:62 stop:871 length:810 start_codon:yes stop_codon:yes gene_type:complete